MSDKIFDHAVQKTSALLHAVQEEIGLPDRQQAWHLLRATMQTLRDRLPVGEAVDLGAQLPVLLRGYYYEGWHPAECPRRMHRQELIETIADRIGVQVPSGFEAAITATVRLILQHVSAGEASQVAHHMSKDLEDLFPSVS